MKYFIPLLSYIILLCWSCVSSSRYQSLQSDLEQSQIKYSSLKHQNDSLRVLTDSLHWTKEQLAKTEKVLIDFYLKYDGKLKKEDENNFTPIQASADQDAIDSKRQSEWNAVQLEMTRLIKDKAKLEDRISQYESEITALKNEAENKATFEKGISSLKKENKNISADLLGKELEIGKLKTEVRYLKSKDLDIKEQKKINEFLRDSLQAELQFQQLKNSELHQKINDINDHNEESIRLNQQKHAMEYTALQNEFSELKKAHESSDSDRNQLKSELDKNNMELESLKKTSEEYRTRLNEQQLRIDEKINTKDKLSNKQQINQLKSDIKAKETSITLLNDALDLKNREILNLQNEMNLINAQLSEQKREIAGIKQNNQLETENNQRLISNQEISNRMLRDSLQLRNEEIYSLQKSITENKILINQQQLKLEEKTPKKTEIQQKKQIDQLNEDLELMRQSQTDYDKRISLKNQEIQQLQQNIQQNETEISNLKKDLNNFRSNQNSEHDKMQTELLSIKKFKTQLDDSLNQKNKLIEKLQGTITTNELVIQKQNADLQNNKDVIHNDKHIAAIRELNMKSDVQENEIKKLNGIIENKITELSTMNQQLINARAENKKLEMANNNRSKVMPQDNRLTNELQDSIGQLHSETIRLKHVNTALESEIYSNQRMISKLETSLDSLKQINKSQEQSKISSVNQPHTIESSHSIKKLPTGLSERIQILTNTYPGNIAKSKESNDKLYILLSQTYMYEGETMAMTQAGADLVQKLSEVLKIPGLYLSMKAFNNSGAPSGKAFETGIKRSNTLYKMFNHFGINPANMDAGAILYHKPADTNFPASGIELIIHAE